VTPDLLGTIIPTPQFLAESLQVLFQAFFEHRDCHMVHSSGPSVGGNLTVRRHQSACFVDLVDQAEPFASFDPCFQGCQHPLCPDRRFDPRPAVMNLSSTCSPFGHCLWLLVRRFGHRVSTFLHPFAPPELPGFNATMSALTPGPPALRPTAGMNTGFDEVQVSLRFVSNLPIIPSPTTSRRPVHVVSGVFTCRAYRTTFLWTPVSRPLRHLGFASFQQARHDD
jgi:hypothetical protein